MKVRFKHEVDAKASEYCTTPKRMVRVVRITFEDSSISGIRNGLKYGKIPREDNDPPMTLRGRTKSHTHECAHVDRWFPTGRRPRIRLIQHLSSEDLDTITRHPK